MRANPILTAACLGWTSLFWLACVAVPLFAVVLRAASGEAASFVDPDVLSVARATATQAGLSAALSVAIGLPLGLCVGEGLGRGSRAARWGRVLLAIPYGIPTVVIGTAAIAWLGRSGILGTLDLAYSLRAVIAVHVLLNAPWIALWVAQARAQVPEEQMEVARTLGAGSFSRARAVILPYVRWPLAAAATQVFGLCAMSFALVLLLGGGPPVETLETAIYGRIRHSWLDASGAIACAAWQLALTLVPWAAVVAAQARAERSLPAAAEGQRRARPRGSAWAAAALVGASAFFVLPYGVALGPQAWRSFFSPAFREQLARPLLISLGIAASVTAVSLLTTLTAILAIRRLRRGAPIAAALLTAPAGISVLVLALGYWLAYGKWLDPMGGSLGAMIALQAALLVPVAFRALWPVAQGFQQHLFEAATTLGASPSRAFLAVEWPRWRAPLASAAAILAGASLGEVAAVSLFYSERLIPLPLLVTRWMAQYRFEDAQAVSALLLALAGIAMAVVLAFGKEKARWHG